MAQLKITTQAWGKDKRLRELETGSASGAYLLVDKEGWPEARKVSSDGLGAGDIPADALGPGSVAREVNDKLGDVLSAADFGAVDGSTADFKDTLDALLTASLPENKAVMQLSSGTYQLHTTWNPSDRSVGGTLLLGNLFRGGTFAGGKAYVGYTPSVTFPLDTVAPRIVWHGAAAGTMIELDSIIGMAFEGLHLFGGNDDDATSPNRCGIIVNVSQRGIQHGSGAHLFDRCVFADFETSFRFGEGQTTDAGNCDTTEWRGCSWQNGDRGVHITHVQNLVYSFTGITTFTSVKRIFHSEEGGYFNIEMLNARNCGGDGVDDWMFDLVGGSSAGVHRIGPTRLEGTIGCRQILRLVGSYCPVVFDGLFEAHGDQDCTQFDLTGGQVLLRGGKLITHDSSNPCFMLRQESTSGTSTTLVLDGVTLHATEFTYSHWFTHATNTFPNITVRNCVLSNGRPIPNFSTRIENRLPVPLEGSTSDGTTTVALTLLRNGQFGRFDNSCTISKGLHHIRMTIMAGVQSASVITVKQLRAVREFDVLYTGSTITITDQQTIGTDYNPDGVTFTLVVDSARSNIRVDVVGKAATNLFWRAEFLLLDTWSHYSV